MRVINSRNLSSTAVYIVLFIAAICVCFASASGVQAATFTVINTNDSGAGSLRQAIADAASGDTIDFNLSGCPCTITLTSGELQINKDLTILGPGANNLTVSGNDSSRVFTVGAPLVTVRLDGLTVSAGNGVGSINNGYGGGIFNLGTLNITNSTISGNSAPLSGGGINNNGTMNITNCTISGNYGAQAGGIFNNQSTLSITNSSVSGNSVIVNGGGIYNNFGTLTVTNSTVTGNRADSNGDNFGDGGGIFAPSAETLNNTIVVGNFLGTGITPDDISGTIETAKYNLIGDAASSGGITNGTDGNIVGVAVNLVLNTTLAKNGGPTKTHALLPGSPALNAGNNALLPSDTYDLDDDGGIAEPLPFDQRGPGFPRIANTTVDIGAFEGAALVVTKISDTNDGTCDADCSLREAIAAAMAGDTILFDTAGIFASPQVITLSGNELVINFKDLNIVGTGANNLTVSGGALSRVFFIQSATVLLEGLKVTGGNGVGQIASTGGGIANFAGRITVRNGTVSGNTASGVLNVGGTFRAINTTISNNSGGFAGGIVNTGTSALPNSTLILINSTVSGNLGDNAGGIHNDRTLIATNCTITGNRADSDANSLGSGGGIAAFNNETLNNTIVAGNFRGAGSTPDDIGEASPGGGTIETANNNLIGDPASSGGISNNNNGNKVGFSVGDVLNTTLTNNGGPTETHALICDSPALDAGSNSLAVDAVGKPLTTDQRGAGFPRIFNGTVDIGAFEFQQTCNTQPTISGETISRQQGSLVSNSKIATVSDAEDAENTLTVTVNGGAMATINGVTLSNIAVDASGNVTADVVAGCSAADASFTLRVTDSGGLYNEATLNVTVTANTPPTLSYPNASVLQGGSTTVNPATGPSDNGSILSIVVQSKGTYTGTISVGNSTGVVSISNAAPIGSHTITIRATDNCGVSTNAQFTLVVNSNKAADLDVQKSDAADPVLLGNNITYKIEVENDGPGNATGVVVIDTMPAGVIFVPSLSSPGCVESPSQTVTCTIGNLGNDIEARRTIVGHATVAGRFTNTVRVTADQPDPRLSNNIDTESTTVVVGVVSLTLSPTSVKGGSSAVVTGTVTLSSPAPSGGVVVTLSSSNTSVAKPAVNSITISAGSTGGTFTVKHFKVSSTQTVKIKASANGFSKEATLTVTR